VLGCILDVSVMVASHTCEAYKELHEIAGRHSQDTGTGVFSCPRHWTYRVRPAMSWRIVRTGSRPLLRPPAWGDPSALAELYLLKVPVDGASRSFAAIHRNLSRRSVLHVISLVLRRTEMTASRLIASLRAR